MNGFGPILGVFYGELDPYTKNRLEYYEKHKKRYVAPVGKVLLRIFNIVLGIPSFAFAVNAGIKITNNIIWGLVIGFVIMIVIQFLYVFLIVSPIEKYLKEKDDKIRRENDVFYDIVMQGTIMDKDHRAERIKADIKRMKAEGTWKEEYLTEELKMEYGELE